MADEDAIVDRLGAILLDHLCVQAPPPDADLFQSGVLDSLALIELFVRVEEEFGVCADIEELDLEAIRTLRGVARLISARGGTQPAPSKTAKAWRVAPVTAETAVTAIRGS